LKFDTDFIFVYWRFVPVLVVSYGNSHNIANLYPIKWALLPVFGAFILTIRSCKKNPKPGFCIFKTRNPGFDKEPQVYKP